MLLKMEDVAFVAVNESGNRCVKALPVRALHEKNGAVVHRDWGDAFMPSSYYTVQEYAILKSDEILWLTRQRTRRNS
jgi:hypothetical protein